MLGLALGLATLTGCAATTSADAEVDAAVLVGQAARQQPAPRVAADTRYVVAISVDGLNPAAVRLLGPEGAPNLHRMKAEGAGTWNARSAYERTVTLPNHTGMVTGRRVLGKKGHHVTFNADDGRTVHELSGAYRASMFDVVHDRGRRTAFFSAKDKFALLNRSWNSVNGAPDRVGRDHGRDKITRYSLGTSAQATSRLNESLVTKPFALSFLHIALPDLAGHEHGFMSEGYLEAVRRSDHLVGTVLDTIRGDEFLAAHVDVILTADHGGRGASHSDVTRLDNYRVPFLAWGLDVEPGADLYALNPERRWPGKRRPAYADPPPIRNTDLASLATTLLGFPAVPGGLLPGTTPLEVS